MIAAVAFCPEAPVLVRELAGGAAPELDQLRAACRTAIGRLVAPGRQLVVLGGGDRDAFHGPTSRGSFAGFGLDVEVSLGSDAPGPVGLPSSLTVGAWLLRDAIGPNCGAVGYEVPDGVTAVGEWYEHHGDDIAVLVLGDGSARRSRKAPGYLDERAEPADAWVASALRAGDGRRLHHELYDREAELLISGRSTWELLSRSVEPYAWHAELLYDAAPYGVGYFVASWTLDRSGGRAIDARGAESVSHMARVRG